MRTTVPQNNSCFMRECTPKFSVRNRAPVGVTAEYFSEPHMF